MSGLWNQFNNALGSNAGKLATSVIGTAIANKNARKMQETAFAQEQALMDKQNAYNDPSAQMRRLQKAGLNVNMMYGENAATFESANGSAPAPAPVSNFADSTQQFESDMNRIKTKAEVDNLVQTCNNLIEEGKGIILDNACKSFNASVAVFKDWLFTSGVNHKYKVTFDPSKETAFIPDDCPKEVRDEIDNLWKKDGQKLVEAFSNADAAEVEKVKAATGQLLSLTNLQDEQGKQLSFSADNAAALGSALDALSSTGTLGQIAATFFRSLFLIFGQVQVGIHN